MDKYEEKYGKVEERMSILPMAAMGPLIAGIILVVAVIVLLVFVINGNTNLLSVTIPLALVGAFMVFYTVKLFAKCPLECRENAIIVKRVFGDVEHPYAGETTATQPDLDDILCVLGGFEAGGDWLIVCPLADLLTDMNNCELNETVDLDDILAVLGAFEGSTPECAQDPCPEAAVVFLP